MIPADVLDHQADLLVRLENPMVRRAWAHQLSIDSRSALTRQAGVTRSEPGFDRWVDEPADKPLVVSRKVYSLSR